MDLFEIFSGQESWHTRRLLELAKTLNDEQLDRQLKNQVTVFPWTARIRVCARFWTGS